MSSPIEPGLPDEPEPQTEAVVNADANVVGNTDGEADAKNDDKTAENAGTADARELSEEARERAIFDELVASFHSESAPDPVPRWPVIEDVSEAATPARGERTIVWSQPIVELSDDATVDKYFPMEHFEPPEPPPLPVSSGATKASWTLLIGGVLYLLLHTLFQWNAPDWAVWVAVSSVFGGIISLVARMRPDRDDYDDPDNGAVV